MSGIYPKILRQAFHLTKSQKIFWKAGLFLVWPNLIRALLVILFVASWFQWDGAVPAQNNQTMPEGNPWVGLISILALGLITIFYFRYKAIVILAVKQMRDKSQIDKSKIYAEAEPRISGFIKFGLTGVVTLGLVAALLASPVAYLSAEGYAARADILAVLAIIAFLPVAGLVYCALIFAPMFMAVHNITAWDSTRASTDVYRGNWLFLTGQWLVLLAIEVAGLIVSVALFLIAILPFVLLAQIFYDGGGSTGTTVLQALAGIAGFVVFFISQAMVAVFQRVAWTITFFEIVRPVKIEQLEPETAPEIAS
jgi:hypothetical protein